jgi:hypothetical protein
VLFWLLAVFCLLEKLLGRRISYRSGLEMELKHKDHLISGIRSAEENENTVSIVMEDLMTPMTLSAYVLIN